MTAVEVGYQLLNLSSEVFTNGANEGVIIDSGTTLAYLPEAIYGPLVKKVVSYPPLILLEVTLLLK